MYFRLSEVRRDKVMHESVVILEVFMAVKKNWIVVFWAVTCFVLYRVTKVTEKHIASICSPEGQSGTFLLNVGTTTGIHDVTTCRSQST
jgi:hypothetical protein